MTIEINLDQANQELHGKTPEQIVEWALAKAETQSSLLTSVLTNQPSCI